MLATTASAREVMQIGSWAYSTCHTPHSQTPWQMWKPQEHVQVVARVRPFSDAELQSAGPSPPLCSLRAHSATSIACVDPTDPDTEEVFACDQVLWSLPSTPAAECVGQEEIFQCVGVPHVDLLCEGYHSCIFAYGQSASGVPASCCTFPDWLHPCNPPLPVVKANTARGVWVLARVPNGKLQLHALSWIMRQQFPRLPGTRAQAKAGSQAVVPALFHCLPVGGHWKVFRPNNRCLTSGHWRRPWALPQPREKNSQRTATGCQIPKRSLGPSWMLPCPLAALLCFHRI